MAKGQQRSNREAKKPKKAEAEKAKPGAQSTYKQQMQVSSSTGTPKKP